MSYIKKTANITPDTMQAVENVLSINPHISFTLAVNEALQAWCRNPQVVLNKTPTIEADVDKFMKDNSELMDSLAK